MKVIFLDHDGVICLPSEWGGRFKKKGYNSNPDTPLDIRMDNFNKKAIKVLNDILEKTGAELVISSDWRRHGSLKQMQEMYILRGVKPPIDITAVCSNEFDIPEDFPYHRAYMLEQERSLEIKHWLNQHPEVTHWVAIDDLNMSNMINSTYGGPPIYEDRGWGLENFVLTNQYEGIKQCGIKEKILKFLLDENSI